jgi:hypothetical protein
MTKYFGENAFETGQQVRITMGSDKGKIGFYMGMRNNSNWHIVDVEGNEILVNREEIEAV